MLIALKFRGIFAGSRLKKWHQTISKTGSIAGLQIKNIRVIPNGVISDQLSILSGVPQRSVLDPSLFLMYINNIDNK